MSHASSVNGGLGVLDASDCVSEPIRRSDSLNRADTHSMRSRSYNSEGDIQVAIRSMRASSMSQEMVEVSTVGDRRDDGLVGPRKITRTTSHQRSVIIEDAPEADARDGDKGKDGGEVKEKRWKVLLWKTSVYLTTLGMLVALLMGLNMSWSAITAALVLLALDFTDAQACLEKVLLAAS